MSWLLVFIDTETTSLRHDRRAWEIGLIRREIPAAGEVVEHEQSWLINADDLDLGNADLMSLKIGGFHDRHPQYCTDREPEFTDYENEREVLRMVEAVTRGAYLVGNVVDFDADVLRRRMWANGICPSWHYHLIDVEAMAVGYLRAKDDWFPLSPWDSERISEQLNVKLPPKNERHTALGDARWVMRLYDAIMNGGDAS